ncbi:ankyrin repeat and EF-hand domain-containing protein 1 isoform X3 [Grus americana]|uniref:ankyrin repeat and EF-hand domain-containing protein 1 isoform X3 n=1 Tax=Grus americana TaxID=9117 RepID=UPI002407DCD8|nr:ankyrin repeat and EF-hand domain-containing protein 1 isoform X3 [Grus americana]
MLPVDNRLQNLQIYKLLQCVHQKDKKQIEKLVQNGFPNLINFTEPMEGYSALHLTCIKNDVDMCSFLLEQGACPDVQDKMGRTPAMKAAELGHELVLELLAKAKADMTAVDNEGKGVLFYCILPTRRHYHCMQIALDYGADVNNCTTDGKPVFLQACCDPTWTNLLTKTPRAVAKEGGFKAAAAELRRIEDTFIKQSKPGAKEDNPRWALRLYDWSLEHQAALRKAFEAIDQGDGTVAKDDFISVIQKQCAFVDVEQIQTIAEMHEGSDHEGINIAEFFKGSKYLQKNCLITSFGPKGKKGKKRKKRRGKKGIAIPVPICVIPKSACPRREDGFPVYMIEAIQSIADSYHFNRDHPSAHPVHDDRAWYIDEPRKMYMNINYLVRAGDVLSLQKAFEEGVPVDIKDKYYKTPLMVACASGNTDVVQYLLEKGADVNATDNFMWTPLHHACYNGHLDLAELIVKAGAAVDAPAIGNATPLMRAIEICRLDIVYFLIDAGADIQMTNSNGKNALDIAKVFADSRIIDLLQNKLENLPEVTEKKAEKEKLVKPKSPSTPMPAEVQAVKREPSQVSLPVVEKAILEKTAHSLEDSVIYLNSLITSGATRKDDIAFKPRKIWAPEAATEELVRKQELLRERLALDGHSESFTNPFNRKVME